MSVEDTDTLKGEQCRLPAPLSFIAVHIMNCRTIRVLGYRPYTVKVNYGKNAETNRGRPPQSLESPTAWFLLESRYAN